MSEDNNHQNDQPNEEQESSDNNEIEYREISQAELDVVTENHKKWLNTDAAEGLRAKLQDLDLSKINFTDTDLSQAYFDRSNLQDADFSNGILQKAIFNNANLKT